MNIIFNADDFGYCRGINYGIMEACKNGVVRSATVMANMPAFEHAVEIAHSLPTLGVGVHLNFSCGESLGSGYKTLTNDSGEFFVHTHLYGAVAAGKIDPAEVENEYILQIEKVIASGIKPTHLDGHHHLHSAGNVLEVTLRLAEKYKLPLRLGNEITLPAQFSGIKRVKLVTSFSGESASLAHLETLLASCNADTEIMCHPGYVDSFMQNTTSYCNQRLQELDVLTSPQLFELLQKFGHMPASYFAT